MDSQPDGDGVPVVPRASANGLGEDGPGQKLLQTAPEGYFLSPVLAQRNGGQVNVACQLNDGGCRDEWSVAGFPAQAASPADGLPDGGSEGMV